MIGQTKLQNKVSKLNLDNCPHTIALVGAQGCGKHLLSDIIANKLGLNLIDITDNLNLDTINDIMIKPEPCCYRINASEISLKEENVILKFLEEPLSTVYILLLCENKNQLIATVANRCQMWNFETYTDDELKQFIPNDKVDLSNLVLDIAKTPGNVENLCQYDICEVLKLAENVILNVSKANFSNVLTISNKLKFKKEDKGFDFDLFVDILVYTLRNKLILGENLTEFYKLTNKLSNDRHIFNVNKKYLFEHYLSKLKTLSIEI